MKYKDKVERMAVAIHESWERSRNSSISDFGTTAGMEKLAGKLVGKKSIPVTVKRDAVPCATTIGRVMHAKWDADMIAYKDLPDPVKEYDRMEARQVLAMMGILPIHIIHKQRHAFNSCVNSRGFGSNSGKYESKNEARAHCFRDLKLYCDSSKYENCDPFTPVKKRATGMS